MTSSIQKYLQTSILHTILLILFFKIFNYISPRPIPWIYFLNSSKTLNVMWYIVSIKSFQASCPSSSKLQAPVTTSIRTLRIWLKCSLVIPFLPWKSALSATASKIMLLQFSVPRVSITSPKTFLGIGEIGRIYW